MDLHRSHWPVRVTAGITALVFVATLAGFGPASLPAQAADPLTALYLDAEDHGVGVGYDPLGKSWVNYGEDADSVVAQVRGNTTDYWYIVWRDWDAPEPAGGQWIVWIAGPEGSPLSPGTYTNVSAPSERAPGQAGIEVSGGGNGCSQLTGGMTVHESAITDFTLDRLSASFWFDCDDNPNFPPSGKTWGEIRFNATSGGFKGATAKPWSIDFGLADSLNSAGTRNVTVESIGTQTLNVSGSRIIGPDASSFDVASDGCSGASLAPGQTCVISVSATPQTNRVLDAELEVSDDTARGKRTVHLTVRGIGEVDGTAVISPQYYYPVQDGYEDQLTVEGTRNGEQTLNVKVRAAEDGSLVYEDALPPGSGDYRWTWNGHIDGQVIPAGNYDVTATLGDSGPNKKVVTERIYVRHDYVTWVKKTAVRQGREIWAWGRSKNASLSTGGSAWSTGLRLNSGKGFGAIVYSFPVARSASNIYGWMSFEVSGKSRNKHKALLAIWNPKLGAATNLSNYDVAKKVGPRFRWWKTGVNGQKHKKNGKARAAVMVWKGLGGWGKSIFDVRRVRLVYKVGTLHRVTTASEASALGQALRSRGPDGVVGTRVSRVPGSDVLPPLSMAPSLEAPPPEATDPVDPSPVPGEPGADATAAPGADESRPSRGSRGRLPAPDSAPDPAPTDDPAD